MVTNSKKLQNNIAKFRKFKPIVLIVVIVATVTISFDLLEVSDAIIVCLLTFLLYLRYRRFINESKLFILHEHIREMTYVDKTIYQILEETNESSDINHMLGKKYKGMLKQMHKVEQYIYETTLRGKQSEEMANKVVVDVAKNLVLPIDKINDSLSQIKENNLDDESLNKIEEEVYNLKNTINELFELSKAVTNTMELNIEKIDINSLIKQSLTEYEVKFDEANLILKRNFNSEKIFVNADGEKIWRVFEIILDNISTYAKENTRVYINVENIEDKVMVSMSNISKEELNISVDEFYERLNKNSCLGLAIATNLMRVQNGNLNLDIDGDMFKVILSFNKATDEKRGDVK